MHICFFAGGLGQGGAEKQLVYMAAALQSAGHAVTVISLSKGGKRRQAMVDLGVRIIDLPSGLSRHARTQFVRRFVIDGQVDVLQAAHTWLNPYVSAAVVRTGAIAVGAIRSDGRMEISQHAFWGRLSLTLPRTLITNSILAADVAHRFDFGRSRDVAVVPNVIGELPAVARLHEAGGDSPREVVTIVTVANLVKAKRLELVVEAFSSLRAQVDSPVQLVIAGDGPELASLKRLVAASPLTTANVEFAGRIDDVSRLMSSAHIFVLTSDHEGFPNTVLEAMSVGLPVVATAAGAVPEVVLEGVTGRIVPCGDAFQIAGALSELVGDAQLRRRLGSAGRRRVADNYLSDGLKDRLEKIYSRAMER